MATRAFVRRGVTTRARGRFPASPAARTDRARARRCARRDRRRAARCRRSTTPRWTAGRWSPPTSLASRRAAPVPPAVVSVAAARTRGAMLISAEAARSSTGAPIPASTDAVVPFERLGGEDARRRRALRLPRRQHIRRGRTSLPGGRARRGRELLATTCARRLARFSVERSPRAARRGAVHRRRTARSGQLLRPGAIHNNLPMLATLVTRRADDAILGRQTPSTGPARRGGACEASRGLRRRAHDRRRLGGRLDPVKQALTPSARSNWRVAPAGHRGSSARRAAVVLGLPGNPASVACVFEAPTAPARLRCRQATPRSTGRAMPVQRGDGRRVARGPHGLRALRARVAPRRCARTVPAGASGLRPPHAAVARALLVVPRDADLRLQRAATRAEALLLRVPGSLQRGSDPPAQPAGYFPGSFEDGVPRAGPSRRSAPGTYASLRLPGRSYGDRRERQHHRDDHRGAPHEIPTGSPSGSFECTAPR